MSAYRALDMLIKQHPPKVAGRAPYWRPEAPKVHREVRTPAWNWRVTVPDDVEALAVLDVNAAYLAAMSSVEVAHGKLTHTGAITFDRRRPGYWQITVPTWNHPTIMSPVGSGQQDLMWVTTPTLALLTTLEEHGLLVTDTPHDSYTSDTRCRLRAWTDHVKTDRAAALAAGDTAQYEDIKQGYSSALTILGNEIGSAAFRPDWSQHGRAQHAATMWRTGYRLTCAGIPVYAARTVDELVIRYDDAVQIWRDQQAGLTTPVKIDQEGRTLGTVKVKAVLRRGDEGWPA